MQLINYNYKVSQNFVYVTFKGNIFKLKPTESFELSFERLGGIYIPEESGEHGSVWKFPSFVSSQIIQEIIRNTCFECGGLMMNSQALQNTLVTTNDFDNDAGQRGSTQSQVGSPIIKDVRKCTSCGHSHT